MVSLASYRLCVSNPVQLCSCGPNSSSAERQVRGLVVTADSNMTASAFGKHRLLCGIAQTNVMWVLGGLREMLLGWCPPGPVRYAYQVGCGTGQLLPALARLCRRPWDLSPESSASLTKKARRARQGDNRSSGMFCYWSNSFVKCFPICWGVRLGSTESLNCRLLLRPCFTGVACSISLFFQPPSLPVR